MILFQIETFASLLDILFIYILARTSYSIY